MVVGVLAGAVEAIESGAVNAVAIEGGVAGAEAEAGAVAVRAIDE